MNTVNIIREQSVEFISSRKDVFYPREIIDMIMGKGEYAYSQSK